MNGTNGPDAVRTLADEGHAGDVGDGFTLLVGTFRSPQLYTLNFKPPSVKATACKPSIPAKPTSGVVSISHKSPAVGGHSWLALSPDHTRLYATCWADPPSVASYRLDPATKIPHLLNTKPVAALSGYVAVTPSGRHLLSVGGPSGEVFRLDDDPAGDGRIGALVQSVPFRTAAERDDGRRDGVAHGSFGGLRWGAHSVDVGGPGGRCAYVADIGHNCIWAYELDEAPEGSGSGSGSGSGEVLRLRAKHISPRAHDGPRHCWPHPAGRVLYCVQEHSSMVDAFAILGDGRGSGSGSGSGDDAALRHLGGETILPADRSAGDFWADEVRTSNLFSVPGADDDDDDDEQEGPAAPRAPRAPRYLYASTRGLESGTKGYVAAYELDAEGRIAGPALEIYETRTSGGLANAVEPAPRALYAKLGSGGGRGEDEEKEKEEYIALTDSEEGWVVILGWDGRRFREVAAVQLKGEDGAVAGAATAVWL